MLNLKLCHPDIPELTAPANPSHDLASFARYIPYVMINVAYP